MNLLVTCDKILTPAWMYGLVWKAHASLCLVVWNISNVIVFVRRSISEIYSSCSIKKPLFP